MAFISETRLRPVEAQSALGSSLGPGEGTVAARPPAIPSIPRPLYAHLAFSAGSKYTATLNIEPIKSCACFQHNHTCLQHKGIDFPAAVERLNFFVKEHCNVVDRSTVCENEE